jgi:uncharacterized protein (DUF2235 family)
MFSGRQLALFLDGTWNTTDDNTNIWRLRSICETGQEQDVYYNTGVGTAFGERLRGGLFGYGLSEEVIQAYRWMMETYRPGDRIFIFGFSRGAFTARSLSGFISKCGMLKPGAPMSLKQLYARYRREKINSIRRIASMVESDLSQEEKWLKRYSMPIPIWFQGLFDTVGALGVPFGNFPRLSRTEFSFLETDLRINNTRAFQALAIDEHREAFAPTLWKKTVTAGSESYPPRSIDDVEQRWFTGAHADIGGGYENGLLAQHPLRWLLGKAKQRGLRVKDEVEIDLDANLALIHDSFAQMGGGAYRMMKLGKRHYREIGSKPVVVGNETTTTINESIDASVFDRWRDDKTYRPKNLVTWASVYDVDPAKLTSSVRADNPRVVVSESPTVQEAAADAYISKPNSSVPS